MISNWQTCITVLGVVWAIVVFTFIMRNIGVANHTDTLGGMNLSNRIETLTTEALAVLPKESTDG